MTNDENDGQLRPRPIPCHEEKMAEGVAYRDPLWRLGGWAVGPRENPSGMRCIECCMPRDVMPRNRVRSCHGQEVLRTGCYEVMLPTSIGKVERQPRPPFFRHPADPTPVGVLPWNALHIRYNPCVFIRHTQSPLHPRLLTSAFFILQRLPTKRRSSSFPFLVTLHPRKSHIKWASMIPRAWRDDSPRGSRKLPAQRRSPGFGETYLADDGSVRRDLSPDGPRGSARRRYPREGYDDPVPERPLRHSDPHGPHSPAPRYRKSEPDDPQSRHRRRRTADDDDPSYDDQRHRGRDEHRKQTWHPGKGKNRREIDDYLPPRYRSTTASPPTRHDRRSATYAEPGRERIHSPSREYSNAQRSKRHEAHDEKGRGRDDMDGPSRRRRGRARSLDSDDGFRSKGSPRNKSYPPRKRESGKAQSLKKKPGTVAGLDIPWGTFAAAAFQAGASAAYKARRDPGPWMGKKGTKVATAALGAAIVDTMGSGMKGGKKRK